MLEISPFPTLIWLKDFFGCIQRCVTVFGNWVFDRIFTSTLPLTRDDPDYCCNNDDKRTGMNSHQELLKSTRFFQTEKIYFSFRGKNQQIVFYDINMF